jgi:hypothetical protein
MQIDPIKYAMNRAYQFLEEHQEALDDGKITEAQWFDIHNEFFTDAYLSANNPRAQSGCGGDETRWRYSRGMLLLEYVPLGRQKYFVNHLFVNYVAKNGRLIIGLYSEERDKRELESQIHDWGYNSTGYCEKSKTDNEIVSYKILWIDKD